VGENRTSRCASPNTAGARAVAAELGSPTVVFLIFYLVKVVGLKKHVTD